MIESERNEIFKIKKERRYIEISEIRQKPNKAKKRHRSESEENNRKGMEIQINGEQLGLIRVIEKFKIGR